MCNLRNLTLPKESRNVTSEECNKTTLATNKLETEINMTKQRLVSFFPFTISLVKLSKIEACSQ